MFSEDSNALKEIWEFDPEHKSVFLDLFKKNVSGTPFYVGKERYLLHGFPFSMRFRSEFMRNLSLCENAETEPLSLLPFQSVSTEAIRYIWWLMNGCKAEFVWIQSSFLVVQPQQWLELHAEISRLLKYFGTDNELTGGWLSMITKNIIEVAFDCPVLSDATLLNELLENIKHLENGIVSAQKSIQSLLLLKTKTTQWSCFVPGCELRPAEFHQTHNSVILRCSEHAHMPEVMPFSPYIELSEWLDCEGPIVYVINNHEFQRVVAFAKAKIDLKTKEITCETLNEGDEVYLNHFRMLKEENQHILRQIKAYLKTISFQWKHTE